VPLRLFPSGEERDRHRNAFGWNGGRHGNHKRHRRLNFDVPPGTYTVSAPQQEEPGHYSATVTVNNGATVNVSLQITEP
jgi:hypothetical protein